MAKLHQKGVIVAVLMAFSALLLLSACSTPNTPRSGNVTCYNDSDCPSWTYNQFCDSNRSACTNTTRYWCIAPGTENSICALNATTISCTPCANGCINGSCLPRNSTPDLIIRDIAYRVIDNQNDVKLNLTVSVMNNGTAMAGQSVTLLKLGGAIIAQYPTQQLSPQQTIILQPPATVVQARGTSLTVTATADSQDQVVELSETNNLFTLIVR